MDKTIDGNGIKRLLKNISTKINEALNDSVFGAFNMRSTSSFNWDNNKVGKPKAGTYYKVSEVVPTIEQLEMGGNVTFIGLEGTEVIPFTSNDLDTSKEGAIAIGWPFVIISDAGTIWDGYTFSETGIYFYSSEDGYVSALKITSQASEGLFNEFLLKIGCLPKHAHSWSDLADALCGEYYTETGASIVKGDGIDHAGFTKVSDKVVELSAITRGGTLKYTQGTVNKTIDFPGGDYALTSSNDGVLLTVDGLTLVVFAFVDNPVFGSIRFNTVTEKGIHFLQDGTNYPTALIVNELTLNGYSGFPGKVIKKLDKKYLPDDIGGTTTGGSCSWHDVAEVVEETGGSSVKSDKVNYGEYHKVSDSIPTAADLSKGYTVKYYDSNKILKEVNSNDSLLTVQNTSDGLLITYDGTPLIAIAFVQDPVFGPITIPSVTEAGTHFKQDSYFCVLSLDITDYTGFPLVTIEKIPERYLPFTSSMLEQLGLTVSDTLTWDGDTTDLLAAEGATDIYRLSPCVPTIEDFENGWTLVTASGETISNTLISEYKGMLVPQGGEFMIAPTDDVNADGIIFPKKGIYSYDGTDGMVVIKSLTIKGYNNFVSGKIRKEFLELS